MRILFLGAVVEDIFFQNLRCKATDAKKRRLDVVKVHGFFSTPVTQTGSFFKANSLLLSYWIGKKTQIVSSNLHPQKFDKGNLFPTPFPKAP